MDRYRLKFLGSVQVPYHKGNDVLCAAMQKVQGSCCVHVVCCFLCFCKFECLELLTTIVKQQLRRDNTSTIVPENEQ